MDRVERKFHLTAGAPSSRFAFPPSLWWRRFQRELARMQWARMPGKRWGAHWQVDGLENTNFNMINEQHVDNKLVSNACASFLHFPFCVRAAPSSSRSFMLYDSWSMLSARMHFPYPHPYLESPPSVWACLESRVETNYQSVPDGTLCPVFMQNKVPNAHRSRSRTRWLIDFRFRLGRGPFWGFWFGWTKLCHPSALKVGCVAPYPLARSGIGCWKGSEQSKHRRRSAGRVSAARGCKTGNKSSLNT